MENEAREIPIFFDPGPTQLLFGSGEVVAVSGLKSCSQHGRASLLEGGFWKDSLIAPPSPAGLHDNLCSTALASWHQLLAVGSWSHFSPPQSSHQSTHPCGGSHSPLQHSPLPSWHVTRLLLMTFLGFMRPGDEDGMGGRRLEEGGGEETEP